MNTAYTQSHRPVALPVNRHLHAQPVNEVVQVGHVVGHVLGARIVGYLVIGHVLEEAHVRVATIGPLDSRRELEVLDGKLAVMPCKIACEHP